MKLCRVPKLRWLLLLVLLSSARGGLARAEGSKESPQVFEVMLHDTVQPISLRVLEHALDVCKRRGGAALLVNLSTPGGLASSADAMALAITNSPVPVIVFVSDAHTRVSGEGLRVLAAGAVAAMAPGTFLTPLLSNPPRNASTMAGDAEELRRVLRQMSRRQGRTDVMVDELSLGKTWVSAETAKTSGFTDLIAGDEAALLRAVEGRTVVLPGGQRMRLHLEGATVTSVQPALGERLLRALMNPDFAVLFLTLGGLLLLLEFNTPGTVLPGAAGLLLVLLAVYALHLLPLRWPALVLVLLSGVLLLLETRFRQHGILAMLGVCALPVGLGTLVAGPIRELEVSWPTAIGAGLGFGGVTAVLVLLGMEARRAKRLTGAEAMLGWLAEAQTSLTPEGRVLVRGELWKARLTANEAPVEAGSHVRVLRAEGPVLEVTAIARKPAA